MSTAIYESEPNGKRKSSSSRRPAVVLIAVILLLVLAPVGWLVLTLQTARPAPDPSHEAALRELARSQQRDPAAPNRHGDLVAAIDRYHEQRAKIAERVIEEGRRKHPNNTARPYHINLDALINHPDYPDEQHAFEVEDAKTVIADVHARNLTAPIFEILRHPNLANDYRPSSPHPTRYTPINARDINEWQDLRTLAGEQRIMIRLALDEGDLDIAIQLLLDSASIPPVITRQATILEHLIGFSSSRLVLEDAVRIATHAGIDAEALVAISEATQIASDLGDFTAAIRSEQHYYADVLDAMHTSDGRLVPSAGWYHYSDHTVYEVPDRRQSPSFMERLEDISGFFAPTKDDNLNVLRGAIPLLLPAATSPDPSVRQSAIKDCERYLAVHGDQAPVMAESVEMLFGVIDLHWQLQRDITSTDVLLAMAAYRLDTGNWPDSIQALIPAYVDEHPTDPVTGEPLEYRHEPGTPPSLESFGSESASGR